MKQAIILAGGRGTRLKERLGDLPKPMIPVGGRPLLEHQVELALRSGFTDLIFFVCHGADLIRQHFGDGSRWGASIRYIVEQEPLGTAGAVLAALTELDRQFLVFYGDTMINVDLERFRQAHNQSDAEASLLLHPNDHPLDSDLVETDSASRITAFHNRPHTPGVWRQNLVNAGLYVLERGALERFRSSRPEGSPRGMLDFGKDVFPALLKHGRLLHGYNSPEYIKDIGTPIRYDRICAEYESGVVRRSSLSTPQRAVFLDRDGTLVREVSRHGISSADQLDLLAGTAEAIRRLNHAGWRTVVITNQPVIAKGMCSEDELRVIHNKLETLFGEEHAFVDRIYWCPHHPERGFPGERSDLKIECDCRKPKTGMIQRAVGELNVDLSQSWLVGDSTTDVQTARNAGIRSILVQTGYGGADGKYAVVPDIRCPALSDAVDHILAT